MIMDYMEVLEPNRLPESHMEERLQLKGWLQLQQDHIMEIINKAKLKNESKFIYCNQPNSQQELILILNQPSNRVGKDWHTY